jgi:hypothetical protein
MILGGDDLPGWRAPICLPKVIAIDLAGPTWGVRDIGELERE